MTFTHVVTFTWTDGTDDEAVAGMTRSLHAFVDDAAIDGLLSWTCGTDAGLAAANADFAVVATFTDGEAYAVYRDHPEHRRIIDEQIAPRIATRTAVQFET